MQIWTPKRDETRRDEMRRTETKRNETKWNETKRNEMKWDETKRNEMKWDKTENICVRCKYSIVNMVLIIYNEPQSIDNMKQLNKDSLKYITKSGYSSLKSNMYYPFDWKCIEFYLRDK
jgi:hypothetical protein